MLLVTASRPRRAVFQAAEQSSSGRRRRLTFCSALAVLCTLLFLTFLDNTIVSVGLGSVQADLHAGVLALQWILSRLGCC